MRNVRRRDTAERIKKLESSAQWYEWQEMEDEYDRAERKSDDAYARWEAQGECEECGQRSPECSTEDRYPICNNCAEREERRAHRPPPFIFTLPKPQPGLVYSDRVAKLLNLAIDTSSEDEAVLAFKRARAAHLKAKSAVA